MNPQSQLLELERVPENVENNHYRLQPHQVSEYSSLAGALGKSPVYASKPPPGPVKPIPLSDRRPVDGIRCNTSALSVSKRTDFYHAGKHLLVVNQNPANPGPYNQRTSKNAICFECSAGLASGVSLSEVLFSGGVANGQETVLDLLCNVGSLGIEQLNFVMRWPGYEQYAWTTAIDLKNSLTGRKITIQQLLVRIREQFLQLPKLRKDYKKGTISESLPILNDKRHVKFHQLRILQIYSTDRGETWIPEVGIIIGN